MPEPVPQDDPIVSRSLSGPLLLASLLLLGSLAWALYDEFYGLRPWKSYQQRFVTLYATYLKDRIPQRAEEERKIREQAAFQKMEEAMQKAEQAVGPQVEQIDREIRDLDRRISVLTDTFQAARGQVTALVYQAETAGSARARERLLRKIEEAKQGPFRATLPVPDGTVETINFTYDELEKEYNRLKERKAELLVQRVEVLAQATLLRKQRVAYLEEHLPGLNEQQLRGLLRKTETFAIEIKQINVADTELVDRCESCHLGAREPVRLTAADLGGEKAFVSHPRPELLKIHDPERFGCSPCHGGNGRATASVVKAHGRYKHWLWPLYDRENFEAGCQQCHARDMVVEQAEVLNRGKELFRLRGCVGCHRFEGFDDERERLEAARQAVHQLDGEKAETEREIQQSIKDGDAADTNEAAQRLYAHAENLRVGMSRLDAEREQLKMRVASLMQEEKRTGPNLKEVRVKLRRDWIPVWLKNPHEWRPTTKMPRFRLQDDQLRALAAYLWQTGLQARLPAQPRGDAARGKELFETRGCLACHALGEGENAVGGTFAANLSRVGEKANYDFLVRWIHNPRERTRPYCPKEKRDLAPDDYARRGLPFVFDADHPTCPNDGELLQLQSGTVMPSLRLTWEDARDIASYLMTQQKQAPAAYAKADWMEDPKLKDQGRFWIRHYGCAGCHEIAGFEEEGRIGTELTFEGSKPIDRLDFALLTHDAKREDWYDHKGFLEHKLANPAVFDEGKIKEPLERLRMPTPNLVEADRHALVSFLLGSTEPAFPKDYFYRPADRRRNIQEGWWLVTRYNCMGCHQARIGQPSVLMTLPRYQTPEGKDQLPPLLIGAGARLNPDWLVHFLENPALSPTDLNRNGVRPYLRARMPTFSFSVGEIQKLVRFFEALSAQAQPYIPPKLAPLTDRERTLARQLFTHPAAPCLKCHATGDPGHDRTATAPNFLLAKERLKPGWTQRWILDPASIAPGTAMPSGLFRREAGRWVFSGPQPESFRGYPGDHSELLVRYMFELTPDEQRRLTGRLASFPASRDTAQALNLIESH